MNRIKPVLLLLLIPAFSKTYSQQAAAADSVKTALAKANTPEEKVKWLDELSRMLMNNSGK